MGSRRGANARTIAVVTGSRAEYSLYRPILQAITEAPGLALRLMVCGTHWSASFGETARRIEADGFPIADRLVTYVESDAPEGIDRSIARGVEQFGAAFAHARPNIVLLLGDRYEMIAAALAALPFALPIAHIHGGELTEGAMDDAIRHALTKMSHLHFAATETYRQRIIQMGEQPERVIVTGAPGLDAIRTTAPTSRAELERRLGLPFEPAPLLVTYHPATLEYEEAGAQAAALMDALDRSQHPILFTYPNADTSSGAIIGRIRIFVATHARAVAATDLGAADYYGAMTYAAAMVGNSSSGLIEAPSFGLPVVNIGSRQAGRIRAANVIDCAPEAGAIAAAIARATGSGFRAGLKGLVNPFGDGHAAERIVAALSAAKLDPSFVRKRFYDLPIQAGRTA